MASIIQIGERWRALVRRKGHKPECKTFPTKARAEAWAKDIEKRLLGDRASTNITIGALIKEYRDLRETVRPISDSSSEHYMLKNLDRDLGQESLDALDGRRLANWAKKRTQDGAGPYTINQELSKLSTIIRHVCSMLSIKHSDPVGQARPLLSHVGLIGGGGKRERRPTEDELERILEWLGQNKAPIYAEVVRFAVITAMRRSEISRIKWADIDEKKRLVCVRDRKHPRQKKGNDQWVPLLGESWAIAQRQPRSEDDDRIFPVHEQTMSKYFKEACDELGIPDLHFHDLRHEGTSRMFEAGYSIEQVPLVTGHKDLRQLMRYTHLKPVDLHRDDQEPKGDPEG